MGREPTEDRGDALLAALEAEADGDEEEARPTAVADVKSVLEEIGAEEAVAHLDARVAGLEQELERRDARQREAERARRGETDLMRARIDEALELVRTSMDEQRDNWSRFETRFVELVEAAEETNRTHIDELREELTPRVEAALLQLEESEANLRGEVRAGKEAADRRVADVTGALDELRDRIDQELADLRGRMDAEQHERTEATGRIEQLVEQRLAQLDAAVTAVSDELRDEVGALRRELDSAVGELRAGLRLRGSELDDRVDGLAENLSEQIEQEVASLEQRWIDGTRDIARRIERVQLELSEQLAAEREGRRGADDEAAARLDEVAGVVEGLHAAVGQDETRRRSDDEHLRTELDELSSRLDVLQSKVASAVGQIASQLTNRVASLSAEQTAMREAAVRREERFAAVDQLEARVGELGREVARIRELASRDEGRESIEQLVSSVGELRRQLSGVAGTVEASGDRLHELGSTVDRLAKESEGREALRHEVRELTARSAELAERLDETERLARAAGKAIASAVRRSRSAQQQPQQSAQETLFFRPDAPDQGNAPN